MKSPSDDNNNGCSSNWLGFSLSPHMKMEAAANTEPHHHDDYHHHQDQDQPPSAATSFYLSSPHLNTSGLCYGVAENGAFHSPLSVMPLKSDGSLCIMEALTRSSQPQG